MTNEEVQSQPNPQELADHLRSQADLILAEDRLQKAVALYGKTLESGMNRVKAYEIIIECLELGAAALNFNSHKD